MRQGTLDPGEWNEFSGAAEKTSPACSCDLSGFILKRLAMRFNHTTLRLLLTPLILLLGVVGAGAQQARNRIDNRGKEFRVAFLHTNGDDKIPNFMLI
ncbi:MAG: hypothetical protein ABI876_18090, partial [Bacteroidota bacterium]